MGFDESETVQKSELGSRLKGTWPRLFASLLFHANGTQQTLYAFMIDWWLALHSLPATRRRAKASS